MVREGALAIEVSVVLSGGIGLGAYQAGAYERLHAARQCQLGWDRRLIDRRSQCGPDRRR